MANLLGNLLDEIVCNDVATLEEIKINFPHIQLISGRLFDRHLREGEFFLSSDLHTSSDFVEIDADLIGCRNENLFCKVYHLHHPYTYLSCGRICLFAAINEPNEMKFRPDLDCSMQCVKRVIKHSSGYDERTFRRGCAIYRKEHKEIINAKSIARVIVTPLEFEVLK